MVHLRPAPTAARGAQKREGSKGRCRGRSGQPAHAPPLPRSFINAFFYASFPKLAFFNAQVGPNERVMAPLRFPSRTCIPQGGIACIQKGTADAQCDVSLAISCNAFPLPFPLPSVTLLLPLLCLSSSPPQDFSTTLWALGTMRLYPPDTWLEAFQVSGGTSAG